VTLASAKQWFSVATVALLQDATALSLSLSWLWLNSAQKKGPAINNHITLHSDTGPGGADPGAGAAAGGLCRGHEGLRLPEWLLGVTQCGWIRQCWKGGAAGLYRGVQQLTVATITLWHTGGW